MGAAPGHAHGVADDHPDGLLGRAVRPGQGGLGHHGERGGGVRAGRHGRGPRAGDRGAFDVRRGCRDPADPDRRLVDAGQRTDLRDGCERRRRPRALPVQLVGQQVPPVRSRRGGPEAHRLAPGDAPVRGADGPGRRIVLRGRRGHAPHHRTVPPASQPEPGHDPRADRAHAGRVPRGRPGDLARTGASAGPRHRRSHRRDRAVPQPRDDPPRRARRSRRPVPRRRARTTWPGSARPTTRPEERSTSWSSTRGRRPSRRT